MKTFFYALSIFLLTALNAFSVDQDVSQESTPQICDISSEDLREKYGSVDSFKEKFSKAIDEDVAYELTREELVGEIEDAGDLFIDKIILQLAIENLLSDLVAAEYLTEHDKKELLSEALEKYQKVIDFHTARLSAQKEQIVNC